MPFEQPQSKPYVMGQASVKNIAFGGEGEATILLEVDLSQGETVKLFREFLAAGRSIMVEIKEGI